MKRNSKLVALASALILAGTGGSLMWARAEPEKEGKETPLAVSADEMVAAIRVAVAAKPGKIVEVEAESEDGKTEIEVIVQASDGVNYEVSVGPNGKVLEVEREDAEGADEKEDGKDKD